MLKQLRVLLWKEWRQGWAVMLLLWAMAPVVNTAAYKYLYAACSKGTRWNAVGVGFLCLGAALVAGRLFASEGEAGTIHFLSRQPVRPVAVWGVKLATALAFLLVLYCSWIAVDHVGALWGPGVPDRYRVFAWLPLASFSAAFLLSTALDNTVLASLGGLLAAYGDLIVVFALAELRRGGLLFPSLAWLHYTDGLFAAVVLGSTVVAIALSYAAFRLRARR